VNREGLREGEGGDCVGGTLSFGTFRHKADNINYSRSAIAIIRRMNGLYG
jgi:hypothetical protein